MTDTRPRRIRGARRLGFVMALALAGVAPAWGHEYWLAPERYRATKGEAVSLVAFVGTGFRGEPRPYATTRTVRLSLVTRQAADLARLAINGELNWARFELPDDQGALVAFESNFAHVELPAAEFDEYLQLEGLDGPLVARRRLGAAAGPGRERYARCAKAWITGRAAGARRALRPVGSTIEIVPLADPATASPLPVRVLWRGRPLRGALVRAWHSPLDAAWTPRHAAVRDSVGPAARVITDTQGVARLTLAPAGEWLIGAVHMIPCADRNDADWESWWASFTFGRGGRQP